MGQKRFQRRIEDFVCECCGTHVKGSGYTNHCPRCLWSKHVDVNPGDRAASCGGMMEPIDIEGATPEYSIIHRCVRCACEQKNRVDSGDNGEAVIGIAKRREARDNPQ